MSNWWVVSCNSIIRTCKWKEKKKKSSKLNGVGIEKEEQQNTTVITLIDVNGKCGLILSSILIKEYCGGEEHTFVSVTPIPGEC